MMSRVMMTCRFGAVTVRRGRLNSFPHRPVTMVIVMVSALAPVTTATHVRRTVHSGRPLNRVLRLLHAVLLFN